jgi:hypothetical protein
MLPVRYRWSLAVISCAALSLAACKTKRETRTISFGLGCSSKDESCVDSDTAKLCDGDSLATFECRGSEGCRVYGDSVKGVSCDRTVARVGDRCPKPSSKRTFVTCSEDSLEMLACEGGKWVERQSCSKCFHRTTHDGWPSLPKTDVVCE